MNCIIPFTKDLEFKTTIGEILSISLENEYTVNEGELLGNFVITGDYKTHELSVNKEPFEFVLPFSVTLAGNVVVDSIDFNIEDFTYEVIDNKILRVNIEYSVKAEEKEEEKIVFEKEEVLEDDEEFDTLEEIPTAKELDDRNNTNEEEVRNDLNEEKNTILNSINDSDNDFVTYHIHILKENESIESICSIYNTNSSYLNEYNDLSNISVGDKIIIPDIDE